MQKTILKYSFLIILFSSQFNNAQFYFFGRNKVHYEKFEWKILKTEHFDVYYYDNFKEIAEIGANYAEEAYHDLKLKFDHLVISRVPLIFYNTHLHFEQTNVTTGFIPEGVGGFFEFMKGRVVLPYLGSLDQFRHVIRHELVHVFMSSKIANVVNNHRVIAERYPPLWFVEGLAEYWSYHWDTQAEMVMRDAVLNNIFVPITKIRKIYGSFLMYKEGQNFLDFVARTYGEDKILLLMENFWRFDKFKDIMEFTLGESLETIDNKWIYDLKKKYFPLYSIDYPHSINSIKLTNIGFNFSPNYYQSDKSKLIYFIGNHTGYTSIYQMNYNPNSNDYENIKTLIVGEKEKVFESFHLFKPSLAVSVDGNLAFINKSGKSDVINYYSPKQNSLIKTFQFDNLITISGPSFSSDAKQLVFSATDSKGFSDLYILNMSTGDLTRLTNDYYNDKDPIFGKKNNTIVFASDRTDGEFKLKYNLFEYDLKTHMISYITYANANFSTPHYNPSYTKLYFNCDYDGTNNIWNLKQDNKKQPIGMKQVTKFLTSVFNFTFVNNDTLITSGFEKFSFQFYAVGLDKIMDSTNTLIPFKFELSGNKWLAEGLKVFSKNQTLKYKRHYTLDYAVSQIATDPVFGTRGGAILSLSDMLGDDRYYFLIYNTAEIQSDILKNFNVALTKINLSDRTNFGYGIFHFSGRRYDLRQSDEFFFERTYGGFLTLLYPFSSFDRLETTVTLANSDRDLVEDLFGRKALLLSNSISFVHDNSLWGLTGPVDGSRLRLLLGYTSDIKFSHANYFTVIADFRHYFRLGLTTTLAARASIFINDGKEARRFIAGGSWDLRGWPRWSIRGEKLWLSSLEFRFPLIDAINIKFPVFGLSFFGIRGALFFDAGSAWDTSYNETLGSIGGGIRFNFLRVITFRYDIGKKIEKDFTQLQPGLFYQFFFGWDF